MHSLTDTIKEVWQYQHPVMHTWLLFSAISIILMSAVLFFVV